MRRFLPLVILLVAGISLWRTPVQASSPQAYQDFNYQFDQYRQKLSDFQAAYTQYKQFNSLTAQQDALDKVKALLAQRNMVAKTYFLFLNEKLNENPGLGSADTAGYRTAITNQIGLLDQNTVQSQTIGTLADAATVSTAFIKNYNAMQAAYRQTIVGINLGYLQYFGSKFDAAAASAQTLIAASRGDSSPEKQATMDRWMLNLSNQHSLFTEKIVLIQKALPGIKGDVQEQDRQLATIQKTMLAARQDLIEGASYLGELQDALHYE